MCDIGILPRLSHRKYCRQIRYVNMKVKILNIRNNYINMLKHYIVIKHLMQWVGKCVSVSIKLITWVLTNRRDPLIQLITLIEIMKMPCDYVQRCKKEIDRILEKIIL